MIAELEQMNRHLLAVCKALLELAETGVTSLGTIRLARETIERAEGAAASQAQTLPFTATIDEANTSLATACSIKEQLIACEALCAAANREAIRLHAAIARRERGGPAAGSLIDRGPQP